MINPLFVFDPKSDSLNDIPALLRLRVIVGYLGEKSQFGWWQSDFFSPSAAGFLDPVFPRTRFLAQVEGAGSAAGQIHDERIGVGRVFHLFRLPEDFEQTFHQRLQEPSVVEQLSSLIQTKDDAVRFLEREVGTASADATGPVLVGEVAGVAEKATLASIGQAYLTGFRQDTPVLPYLKEAE